MLRSTAILLALALAAGTSAQLIKDTTGKALPAAPAYKFASNVAGYLTVSNDLCEVIAALNTDTPDFAAAKKLYTAGKNSKKSDGSVRTLKGMATGDYSGEPFWDTYIKYYKSPLFIDEMVTKALDGAKPFTTPLARREVAMKGMGPVLQMAYVMHELDEAAYKIGAKELSDEKGAPHNVDEAVALYIGEKPDCAPWGTSIKRAALFGTQDGCSSKANTAMIKALNDALAAARKGDMKAFMAARGRVQSQFAVTMAQGLLQYANQLEEARVAKQPTDEYQAEGYAFFRAIEPLISQASASSAATINKIMTPGNPVAAGANKEVAAALEKVYAGLGITKADMGAYGVGKYNQKAAKC